MTRSRLSPPPRCCRAPDVRARQYHLPRRAERESRELPVKLARRAASEAETEDIRAGRHRDVLLARDGERHRRGFHADIGGELPERFAVALIDGGEASVRLAVEDQAAGGGQNAGPGLRARGPGLRNLPGDLAGLDVERAQEALAGLVGIAGGLARRTLRAP